MSILNITKYTIRIMSTYTKYKLGGRDSVREGSKLILGSNGKVHLHNYIEGKVFPYEGQFKQLNPFMPNGISQSYQSDQSISV